MKEIKALIESDPCIAEGKGKNIIPPPEREPLWKGYVEKFRDPLIIVLLVVFVFSVGVALYEISQGGELTLLLEPAGVLVALLLATGVGFIFEVKAAREFEVLNTVKDSRPVKVLRMKDGDEFLHIREIKKSDVVVGDVVKLENGDEIPADGYLLDSTALRIDESNFTGENYANKTAIEADFIADATYPSNFLLRGATVIEGNAIYRVSAVGMDTEEGRGVAKTQEGSEVKTPLNIQLEQLGNWLSTASFVIGGLIIVGRLLYFYFFDGNEENNANFLETIQFLLNSIMIAITLIVVAVPEGLPMSITVSLALSMRKMLQQNNLVRKLHACETMGAATVICTDKTGTLTQNRMTVINSHFPDCEMDVLARSIAVNSTAVLSTEDDGSVRVIGNPTEGALLQWITKNGYDVDRLRRDAEVDKQIPFSTELKYMQTTLKDGTVYIKGASEILLERCTRIAGDETRERIMTRLSGYQAQAQRTLGFAIQQPGGEMTFEGVVGIADPVREDVPAAIRLCKDGAGVRVIIVTGDTPGTALEIGREIGLVKSDEESLTITGPGFAALSDDEAKNLIKNPAFKIISRARPEDKARLVSLLQQNGEVVAVTGDGTNDAPALSKAQVGLSMGDGTSRAKEASDITIIDNSFSSINKAILWGRSLYQNIRRFIIFQMTINVCACLVVLLGAFIGLDSPLTVTQMLWVNLIMDTFAAMALSSLPADQKVLFEKPRKVNSHIINREMGVRILSWGLFFFVFLAGFWQLMWHLQFQSVSDLLSMDAVQTYFSSFFDMTKGKSHLTAYELTVFFTTFVVLQFWNLFNARYYHTDRSLLRDVIDSISGRRSWSASYSAGFMGIAVVILIGQIFIVTFGGEMFDVCPLTLADWGWLLLFTSPVLIIPDLLRTVKNK